MHLVHGGDIRQHRRDRVAGANVATGQIGRKLPTSRIGLRPGEAAPLVNRADLIGIDGGAARQETQGRQRNVVGWHLVQPDIVLVLFPSHRPTPIAYGFTGNRWIPTERSPADVLSSARRERLISISPWDYCSYGDAILYGPDYAASSAISLRGLLQRRRTTTTPMLHRSAAGKPLQSRRDDRTPIQDQVMLNACRPRRLRICWNLCKST